MVLDFEYGINTGNRFLDFVDHDEDPEEFIARQTQPEEKPKKSTKDTKTVTKTTTTTTTKKTTATTATSANTAKANKENVTGKSANTEQRKQQTNFSNDQNQQQSRGDSARGSGRGFSRRGGQDRPPYEGSGNRGAGGGQHRTQRFNKFEGQETGGFEQSGDNWTNESGNDNNQAFGGGYRGRGRGRGRGNYEGGRGNFSGRGRGGRGGRGNFVNRNSDENSQDTTGGWQQTADSQTVKTSGQELETDVSTQERPFEAGSQRGARGHFRSRTFHNNRNYGSTRNQYENEAGGNQDEYRQNRRQHDRQPRNNVPLKPIEKKDGEGAHNWGKQTENPEEILTTDETAETTTDPTAAPVSKDWSQQVDEAEKQITLDEYKKQLELKKRATQEKLPQLNPRAANEGVDPKSFKQFEQEYRKKNEGEESNDDLEEHTDDEENESGDENTDEQISGKKKIITIPLHFKPIEIPRGGPMGSRGGSRRGSGRFRPNRDDQTRSKSPSQQKPGEYQNDEQQPPQQQQQQSRPYRGGSRGQGFGGRGEYRRPGRGSRGGGYNRSNIDSNTPDFDNTVDFPTLPK